MDNAPFRLLVVEDEPDARDVYTEVLTAAGFVVDSAIDGQDAENKIALNKYDLVLLDIITPNKDGIEALEEIKSDPAKFGTPKIIMLSNIAGDIAVEKAMELGANGYMLKADVEPAELINMIKKFLGQPA